MLCDWWQRHWGLNRKEKEKRECWCNDPSSILGVLFWKCTFFVPWYHKHAAKNNLEWKFARQPCKQIITNKRATFCSSRTQVLWNSLKFLCMHIDVTFSSLLFPASKCKAHLQVSWKRGFCECQKLSERSSHWQNWATGVSSPAKANDIRTKLQGATSCYRKLHNPWQLGRRLTRQSCRLGSKQLTQHCTALHNKGRLIKVCVCVCVWHLDTCSSSCYQKRISFCSQAVHCISFRVCKNH